MASDFHPVAQTTECQVRYSHGGNQYENGYAYRWTSGRPNIATLLALATEIAATIGVKMANQVHNGVLFNEVYCRNIDVASAEQATYFWSPPLTGARGGSPVASNEACSVTKRTGLTGRSNKGRNSFSEWIEGDVDGNTVGSTLMGLIANLALSILANRVSGAFAPAVASRKNGLSVPITQVLTLDNNVDSQKTRLNSHGS